MRIKRFEVKENEILGDLTLDFTVEDEVCEKIIIAGENGLGKTTLLNLINESIYLPFNSGEIQKFGGGEIYVTYSFSEDESDNLIEKFDLDELTYRNLEIKAQNIRGQWLFMLIIDGRIALEFNELEFGSSGYAIRDCFNFIYLESILNRPNLQNGDGGRFYKSTLNHSNTTLPELIRKIFEDDKSFLFNAVKNKDLGKFNEDDLKINKIVEALSKLINNKKLIIDNNPSTLSYEYRGKVVPLENMSSGEKSLLSLAATMLLKTDISKKSVVLLEEPENSLHPNWQRGILDFIQMVSNSKDGYNQIISTTHSPIILESNKDSFTKKVILRIVDNELCISCYNAMEENISFSYEAFKLALNRETNKSVILTEGKTDWKNLKAALNYFKGKEEFKDLDIGFHENEKNMGDIELEKTLERLAIGEHHNKIIGIFDADTPIGKKYCEITPFGNNVYALCLPTPNHRSYHKGVCIELLYKDENLKKTYNNRRLYLSSEFNERNLRLISNDDILCKSRNLIANTKTSIENETVIDNDVIDKDGNEIALSKNAFAECVLNKNSPFNEMDFGGFKELFEKIQSIETLKK